MRKIGDFQHNINNLHNTNEYAAILIAHSTKLNENYNNMKIVLEKIKYKQHK